MAKREWTPAQQQAIDERSCTLLVSAAAGSGKTATLTERVIRSLTDEDNPADLSRMLIVTFTRSAAAELRTRISAALTSAIAAGARTERLSRQLLALPTAKISTIDSFCLDLVRTHAVSLGISPAFRLADVAEDRLLKHSLMRRLIEDCYDGTCDGIDPEEFYALIDCLDGDDGSMGDILLSLYEKVGNYARAHHVFADIAAELSDAATRPPFATRWGRYIRETAEAALSPLRARFEQLLREVSADALFSPKYAAVLESDIALLDSIRHALQEGYAPAQQILTQAKRVSLPGGKNDPAKATELYESLRALRDTLYASVSELAKTYYAYTEEEWQALLSALSGQADLFFRLLSVFSERVDAEKRRRRVFSFPDLSRYAFRLLCAEDGGKTPLAEALSRDFDYVYIDEYQDVNEVQHRIFEAISQKRNRFMVGDVKQSIYAFRGAQPEIFAALRTAFPPLGKSPDSDTAELSFAKNFRSSVPILALVNLVFGRHMATGLDQSIGYRDEEDRLVSGTGRPGERVSLSLFLPPVKEKNKAVDGATEGAETVAAPAVESSTPEADPDQVAAAAEEEELSLIDIEVNYVADEIQRLLDAETKKADGELLQPSDIAILLRTSRHAEKFAAALAARGKKSECPTKKGFFLSPEILLVLSLLNVIDNPRRDIYLAGLLCSPLYGFTMDDLITVRREAEKNAALKDATLYEHLVAYRDAHPDFTRAERFFSDLARYRRMAEGRPVDELIWQLYRESGILSLVGADKEGDPVARRENLLLLYDYARRFEGSSYRGLYNFIAYINEAIERDQKIEEDHAKSARTDTVRIMTIHGSKGLEFPVCFVSDCGSSLPPDKDNRVIFDRHFGFSVKMRSADSFAVFNNPIFNVIRARKKEMEIEQLLRLVYVALTRPCEKLYITGAASAALVATYAARAFDGLTKETTYTCDSPLKLLITALWGDDSYDLFLNGRPYKATPCADKKALEKALGDFISAEKDAAVKAPAAPTEPPAAPAGEEPATEKPAAPAGAPALDEEKIQSYIQTLKGRLDFVYPDAHLSHLPGKLSVSKLYPTALDGTEEEEPPSALPATEEGLPILDLEKLPEEDVSQTVPLFLGGELNTAARAGTATHLFLQFCDPERLAANGADAELARLLEKQFLSKEDAVLVRMDEIRAFCDSSLFAELCREGGKLYRELRFHARFPASAFTTLPENQTLYATETLLVQGVMDAVRITPEGELWLIDYKTDRLTRDESRDRKKAEDKLISRHALQLSYYAAACREIFGRLPDRTLIYSLALGDTIELPVTPPEGM